MAMLDPMMAAFESEMRARPRPRRVSTKRNAEIDQSSPAGAAELGRRIVQFWADAGFDITVEVIHAGGPRESPVWGVRSDMIGGLPPPREAQMATGEDVEVKSGASIDRVIRGNKLSAHRNCRHPAGICFCVAAFPK
jgi:hypothetical protein